MSEYDTDIVEWSERQSERLRLHAAAQRSNIDQIDWANIIEEIESVGNEQRFAFQSNLVQAFIHMLKAEAWPLSREVSHWQAEARVFRANAADRFTPSMRQRIDLAKLYRRALRGLPETIDGELPLALQPTCQVSLDELISED